MLHEGTHLNENLQKNINLGYPKFYRESITNSIKTFYPGLYLKLVDTYNIIWRVLYECLSFIAIIKRVEKSCKMPGLSSILSFLAMSLINSIIQEHEC